MGNSTSSYSKSLWFSLLVFQRLYQEELHITIRKSSLFSQQQVWEKFIQQALWWNKRALAMVSEESSSASYCLHLLSLVPPTGSSFTATNNYICNTALLWNFFLILPCMAKLYKLLIITFKIFNFSIIDCNIDFVRQKEEKRQEVGLKNFASNFLVAQLE